MKHYIGTLLNIQAKEKKKQKAVQQTFFLSWWNGIVNETYKQEKKTLSPRYKF